MLRSIDYIFMIIDHILRIIIYSVIILIVLAFAYLIFLPTLESWI